MKTQKVHGYYCCGCHSIVSTREEIKTSAPPQHCGKDGNGSCGPLVPFELDGIPELELLEMETFCYNAWSRTDVRASQYFIRRQPNAIDHLYETRLRLHRIAGADLGTEHLPVPRFTMKMMPVLYRIKSGDVGR